MKVVVSPIEALNLTKIDPLLKFNAKCSVCLGNSPDVRFTKEIENTNSPKWDQTFTFLVDSIESLNVDLNAKLYDGDSLFSTFSIPLTKIAIGFLSDEWYEMSPVNPEDQGPQLRLTIHIYHLPPEEGGKSISVESSANNTLNEEEAKKLEEEFSKQNEEDENECMEQLEDQSNDSASGSNDNNGQSGTLDDTNKKDQHEDIENHSIENNTDDKDKDKDNDKRHETNNGNTQKDVENHNENEDNSDIEINENKHNAEGAEENKYSGEEEEEDHHEIDGDEVSDAPNTIEDIPKSPKSPRSPGKVFEATTKEDKMRTKILNMKQLDNNIDYDSLADEAAKRARAIYNAFYRRNAKELIANHKQLKPEEFAKEDEEEVSISFDVVLDSDGDAVQDPEHEEEEETAEKVQE